MIEPKASRKAALILGKAAGALILAAVGGTVTWLLDKGRREILDDTRLEEEELVIDLPREAEPENVPEADDEA